MDFYDKLKSFLGLSTPQNRSLVPYREEPQRNHELDNRDGDHRENYYRGTTGPRNFDIFSDPLEITKYFEREMNDMMKMFNFGFGNFGNNDGFFGSNLKDFEDNFHDRPNHLFGHRSEGPESENIPSSDLLRDQFLKPGYSRRQNNHLKEDEDMDGKVDMSHLDRIFEKKERENSILPKNNFQFQSFGKSMTSKTITRSDGTIEMHNTTRDSDGNEETKITRKMGDKEYTVVKQRTKDGTETVTENFVNIDQNDVNKYFPPSIEDRRFNEFEDNSLFSKIFNFSK